MDDAQKQCLAWADLDCNKYPCNKFWGYEWQVLAEHTCLLRTVSAQPVIAVGAPIPLHLGTCVCVRNASLIHAIHAARLNDNSTLPLARLNTDRPFGPNISFQSEQHHNSYNPFNPDNYFLVTILLTLKARQPRQPYYTRHVLRDP